MTRILTAFLAVLALASAALAQSPPFPQSMPPLSFVGNLSPLARPGTAIPLAQLQAAILAGYTPVNDANYPAVPTDRTIVYTAISAARTVTLLPASTFAAGTRIYFADASGSASASNIVSLVPTGADTINGQGSGSPFQAIASPYGSAYAVSDGTSKWTASINVTTVNANVGTFGSSTQCVTLTVNAKGLVTAASATTCTPAFSSLTGNATLAQLPSLAPGQIYQVPETGSTGAPSAQSSRTQLTAPITFFTNADGASSHACGAFTCSPGSDSNNCLTITTPCQTIQHTVSTEASLFDFAAQAVTFQLAETTYNECVLLPTYITSTNQGRNVTILGNLSTPANVVINCASGNALTAVNVMYGWIIKGVTVKASGTCIYADHSRLFPDGVAFNACVGNDVQAVNSGAFVEFINDNYTATTNKTCHAQAVDGGEVLWQAVTLTQTGTPVYSTGLECSQNGGVVDDTLLTLSGAFSGPKYNISGRMLVFSTGATSTTQNSTQFIGASSVSNSEINYFTIGTLSNKAIQLIVNLGGAGPPSGQTMTFTMRLGGNDTALTCQIANPATSCSDLTHSAAVTSGTVADLKIVSSATSGAAPVSASVTMQ